MAKKENLDCVVSFRLSEKEFAPYKPKLESSNLTKSKFFRETFLNSNVTFEEPSKDLERLLFYYSKSSNNLNQLSHSIHRAWRREIISESLYTKLLNELVHIRELLHSGVNNAD